MKDDVRILFNLKCYLESLLASGQDKIYYNDLLYDEKTIDCINAIEDLLKERKKYTIRLTDEEYGRVIDIAQKDIAEQKDKRIKELEADLKSRTDNTNKLIEVTNLYLNSISRKAIIDKIVEVHNMKFRDDRLDSATIDFAVHKFEELLEGEE